jgi:hypothetical protein
MTDELSLPQRAFKQLKDDAAKAGSEKDFSNVAATVLEIQNESKDKSNADFASLNALLSGQAFDAERKKLLPKMTIVGAIPDSPPHLVVELDEEGKDSGEAATKVVLDEHLAVNQDETAKLRQAIADAQSQQQQPPLPTEVDTLSGKVKFTYDQSDHTTVTKLEQSDGVHYDRGADGTYQQYNKDGKVGDPRKLDIQVEPTGAFTINDLDHNSSERHMLGGLTVNLEGSVPKSLALPPPFEAGWHLQLDEDTYHAYDQAGVRADQTDYKVESDAQSNGYKISVVATGASTLFKADGSQVVRNDKDKVTEVDYLDRSVRGFALGQDGAITAVTEKSAAGTVTQWKVEDGKLVEYSNDDPPKPTGQSLAGKPLVDDKTGDYQVVGNDGNSLVIYHTDGTKEPADPVAPISPDAVKTAETTPQQTDASAPLEWGKNGRTYLPKLDADGKVTAYEYTAVDKIANGANDTLWWVAKDSLRGFFPGKEPTDAEVWAQVHQIAKDSHKEGDGIDPNEINILRPGDKLTIRPPQRTDDADHLKPDAPLDATVAAPEGGAAAKADGPQVNADGSTTVYAAGHPVSVEYTDHAKATFTYGPKGLTEAVLKDGRHFVLKDDGLFHVAAEGYVPDTKLEITVLENGDYVLKKGENVVIVHTNGQVDPVAKSASHTA